MKDSQLKKLLSNRVIGRHAVGRSVYFRVSAEGSGFWIFRYTLNGKRREITIGRYGKRADCIGLDEAHDRAAKARIDVRQGKDPALTNPYTAIRAFETLDSVFDEWIAIKAQHIQTPSIPTRIYKKELKPALGDRNPNDITPHELLKVLQKITQSGRPTISNDALSIARQIFDHAMIMGLCERNPASCLREMHAGGKEESRTRALGVTELEKVFRVLRTNKDRFTRDNYIAFCLLLTLGVRKRELIEAKWEEFDLELGIWSLPATRNKSKKAFRVAIPNQVRPMLNELKVKSYDSEYLFPSRRSGKYGHISSSTLNHALAKLFGKQCSKGFRPEINVMAKEDIEHFTIHDLRRSCRTLLASINVPPHVAERVLNHSQGRIIETYDKHDYIEERRSAQESLTDLLLTSAKM
ncbi:site-specific integrase [Ferrimonas pelagia]|uniref:Tyrosine-type recombinase/integrase n=1 Tax=Ferrimonas pelagia TaxID=1177826 RepID=A0ABP9F536_9GAMM